MKQAIAFLQANHGPQVRAAIGTIAVLVALTYTLGYLTGQFVHGLNDQLAGVRPIPTITAPAMLQRPAVSMALSTITAPPIESLTVAQLRIVARAQGHRKLARSGRRAQLLEILA